MIPGHKNINNPPGQIQEMTLSDYYKNIRRMRCYCCDTKLNDYEATLRSANTGEFLDTCSKCLKDSGIKTVGRKDLDPNEPTLDECEEPPF